jgi:PAS domain S-box-containing protein
MLGYQPEELNNTLWAEISYPKDIELTNRELNRLLSGENESIRFIKRYFHKNGSVVWCDVSTSLRRDINNKPLYYMSTVIDITEKKKAEDALRLKNLVFDVSISANSIADLNGKITEANAAFANLWGYPDKEAVIGKLIPSFLKYPEEANEIVNALQNTGNWEGDYIAIRMDGTLFIAHGLATSVVDETGKIIGFQSAVIDITHRKKQEDEIQKLNEELEEKVLQRTEELASANRELEAFSYSVSHDLRSPLRAIHSFTSILIEDYGTQLDEEGKRICSIIETSTVHMGNLIDDLLAFSRAGRTELSSSKIDMTSLVRSVFAELVTHEEQQRIEFKIEDLQHTSGDLTTLRLVWTNLISNAIKYSSGKEKSILKIGSENKDDQVVYFIEDNGAGFDMKYYPKLFGVFQRLHSQKEFDGNGVGLAIVQRIIKRHNGNVWAIAELNKGATFYFSLPQLNKDHKI